MINKNEKINKHITILIFLSFYFLSLLSMKCNLEFDENNIYYLNLANSLKNLAKYVLLKNNGSNCIFLKNNIPYKNGDLLLKKMICHVYQYNKENNNIIEKNYLDTNVNHNQAAVKLY